VTSFSVRQNSRRGRSCSATSVQLMVLDQASSCRTAVPFSNCCRKFKTRGWPQRAHMETSLVLPGRSHVFKRPQPLRNIPPPKFSWTRPVFWYSSATMNCTFLAAVAFVLQTRQGATQATVCRHLHVQLKSLVSILSGFRRILFVILQSSSFFFASILPISDISRVRFASIFLSSLSIVRFASIFLLYGISRVCFALIFLISGISRGCFTLIFLSSWISRVQFALIFLLYGISRVRFASIFLKFGVSRGRFALIFFSAWISRVRFTSILKKW
jgi:hypothetical protein